MNSVRQHPQASSGAIANLDRFLLLILIVGMRAPTWSHVSIDNDEGLYLVIAREILAGHWPYTSVFEEKPVGALLLMTLNAAVFGTSIIPLRALGALAVVLASWAIREIALTAGLARHAAMGSAILFGIMTTRLGGLATNMEILFIPLTCLAVWIAIRHIDAAQSRTQMRAVALMGACIGLAVWEKYIAGFTGSLLFVWLVGSWLWNGVISWQRSVILSLLYGAICATPTVLTALAYIQHGQWELFWYSNFGFMPHYRAVPFSWGVSIYLLATNLFSLSFILIPAAFGMTQGHRKIRFVILCGIWLAAEAIAVTVPMKFFDHYFLLLLPPLSLLGGLWIDSFREASARLRLGFVVALCAWSVTTIWAELAPWKTHGYAAFLILIALPGVSVFLFRRVTRLFVHSWPRTGRRAVHRFVLAGGFAIMCSALAWPAVGIALAPDPVRDAARVIRNDNGLGASLWVPNAEVIIYVLNRSPVPTRFVFPQFLTGPFGEVARIDQVAEVSRIFDTQPRYLAVDPDRWKWTDPKVLLVIQQRIQVDYRLIATVGAPDHRISIYKWAH